LRRGDRRWYTRSRGGAPFDSRRDGIRSRPDGCRRKTNQTNQFGCGIFGNGQWKRGDLIFRRSSRNGQGPLDQFGTDNLGHIHLEGWIRGGYQTRTTGNGGIEMRTRDRIAHGHLGHLRLIIGTGQNRRDLLGFFHGRGQWRIADAITQQNHDNFGSSQGNILIQHPLRSIQGTPTTRVIAIGIADTLITLFDGRGHIGQGIVLNGGGIGKGNDPYIFGGRILQNDIGQIIKKGIDLSCTVGSGKGGTGLVNQVHVGDIGNNTIASGRCGCQGLQIHRGGTGVGGHGNDTGYDRGQIHRQGRTIVQ